MVRLVDLTMVIEEGMVLNSPFHPRAPLLWMNQRHDVTQWFHQHLWTGPDKPPLYDGLPPEAGQPGRGHGQQSEQVIIGTHMGAHMDAALHFDNRPDAQDAAAIPLESCFGPAVMLDLREVTEKRRVITRDDLNAAEEKVGGVREGDIVILHTGNAARYAYGPTKDSAKYFSEYPGLDYDTPEWFIRRRVRTVGSDTHNIDRDRVLSCHVNFLLRGWIGKQPIQIVENLCYLERVQAVRFTFLGLPLPIRGGSGSPIRAVAIVEDEAR